MIDCPDCDGHGFHVQPHIIYHGATREMAMDAGDPSLEGYPVPFGEEYEQVPCQRCNGEGKINE